MLGPQDLDPAAALAGECSGALYPCELAGGSPEPWDPARCTPWVPADEPTGGGPTTGDEAADPPTRTRDDSGDQDAPGERGRSGSKPTNAGGTSLALLALGLLARRRRRRR